MLILIDVEANKDLNEIGMQPAALDSRKFPSHICSFVRNTFESIHQSNLEELAAIFLFKTRRFDSRLVSWFDKPTEPRSI